MKKKVEKKNKQDEFEIKPVEMRPMGQEEGIRHLKKAMAEKKNQECEET